MPETKLELTKRLYKAGLLKEAEQFRNDTRLRLKSEKMKRADANARSWELTAEKYPPPPPPVVVVWPKPPRPTETPSFSAMVRWTADHLNLDPFTMNPALAPHPGCIGMLKLAIKTPDKFFSWLAEESRSDSAKVDGPRAAPIDDKRTSFKLLDLYLEELKRQELAEGG